ncbi:M12 family metallopeptidase [Chitinimonas sp. BJB300]|nr:M12 family metallopeptidase [Chitinimonas sp. BJB300]PHV10519.1 hypothetical protein CSQ89_15770 [Chitinimonas sp. BJB300]
MVGVVEAADSQSRNAELIRDRGNGITESKRGKRAVTTPDVVRWPNRTIPYLLTNASPKARKVLLEAAAEISKNSAIRFVKRTNEADYVYLADTPSDPLAEYPPGFYGERDCHSFIGKEGGPQDLILTPSCQTKGTALHELMHAAGLAHEHQRSDRDQYVNVQPISDPAVSNDVCHTIQPSHSSQYGSAESSLNIGAYDLDSVMQYGAEAGISLRNPTDTMRAEPRNTLSAGDIAGLDALYGGAPINAGPPLTDNNLRVVLSKHELVLAENALGEVQLQVFPNTQLVGLPRIESENPLISVTADSEGNNKFTLKVRAQSGATTQFDSKAKKRLNRVFFHFRTADGKTGVAIFRVIKAAIKQGAQHPEMPFKISCLQILSGASL